MVAGSELGKMARPELPAIEAREGSLRAHLGLTEARSLVHDVEGPSYGFLTAGDAHALSSSISALLYLVVFSWDFLFVANDGAKRAFSCGGAPLGP